MNFEKLNTMAGWERKKALYLIEIAEQLGMNIDSYGEIGVNQNSGNTYLWLEDYMFCLYMPINCELRKSDVYASYSCPEDGTEYEILLENCSLNELEGWANFIYDNKPEEGYENVTDGEEWFNLYWENKK